IKLLVVIDSKARALFIAERREADKLPAPPDKLHLAADNLGDADPSLQFVEKAFRKRHGKKPLRWHQRAAILPPDLTLGESGFRQAFLSRSRPPWRSPSGPHGAF